MGGFSGRKAWPSTALAGAGAVVVAVVAVVLQG